MLSVDELQVVYFNLMDMLDCRHVTGIVHETDIENCWAEVSDL